MTNPGQEILFGPYRLDRDNARLLCGRAPVPLTPKAFDVLHYLASRPDRLVTKEELLSAVWPDVVVSDASVKVCVREIRKALDDGPKAPRYIETVHRRGYRFIGCETDAESSSDGIGKRRGESASNRGMPGVVDCRSTQAASSPTDGLVGRDAEMRALETCFAEAVAGNRQCVCVAGRAGTGKTALVQAFLRRVASEGCGSPVVLAGHCFQQFGTSEPYLPLWEAIGRLARERPSAVLSGLLERHASAQAPASVVTSEPRTLSERLLRDLADAVESLAAETPLVLLLEDLHWADFSTLDVLSVLARRRQPGRLMILATYRPGEAATADHPLPMVIQGMLGAGVARQIGIESLAEAAVAELLATRFAGTDFPPALARRLHQRTDGHPVFLVHLLDDLVEQGVFAQEDGRWRLAGAGVNASEPDGGAGADPTGAWLAVLDTHIPQTVRAMIEAQFERLDPAGRAALEAAAVGGIECSAALVAGALGEDVVRAEHACDELARRHRFLEPGGVDEWPDGTVATHYRFVHELYHNVVYEQIPVARRVRLHQATGARIESAWGEQASEEAAGLAAHFELGRDWPRALKYLSQAAHSATRQYAHREAVHYLRRALAALDRLSVAARAALADDELDVLMCLGVNLQVTQGCAAPEVSEIHGRAYALCQRRGGDRDPANLRRAFPVLWGIWVFHKVRSDLGRAREMARQLLDIAGESGDAALVLQAHQSASITALCLGQPAVALEHLEQAATIYDPASHSGNTERFGQDPGVATMAFGAVALCLLGRPEEAVVTSDRAIELARRSGQPSSLALAMHFAAMLHQLREDASATEQWARATVDLAAAEGFSFWLAGGTVLHGWARVAGAGGVGSVGGATRQEAEAGIAEMRRGVDAWLATGSLTYHAYHLGMLADALLRVGRAAEAAPVLDKALGAARSLPEGLYEAELHRLQAWCTLATAGSDEAGAEARAEECFARAIEVAARQGSRWLEQRVAADRLIVKGVGGVTAAAGRSGS
jgi:DNA-binding winged helix-turn-helix (wHTH) protein/tetratricopeptide (TPR) repeat protein